MIGQAFEGFNQGAEFGRRSSQSSGSGLEVLQCLGDLGEVPLIIPVGGGVDVMGKILGDPGEGDHVESIHERLFVRSVGQLQTNLL